MSLVRGKVYGGTTEILRHADFTAIPVTLDIENIEVDGEAVVEEEGRTIVKAGAILGTGLLEGEDLAVVDNSATADGVLRYDVDITDGRAGASLIIRGEVYKDKLPQEISEEAEEALATRILFIE